MKINDILKLKIIDEDNLGNGISKIDNFVIFVFGALKGEIVNAKVKSIKKNYAICNIEEIIKKSDKRVIVKCPYYGKCNGCNFLHTSYDNERSIKKTYLEKLFKNNIIYYKSNNEINYRNKVTLHIIDGEICYYQENKKDICIIDNCLLLNEKINNLIKKLKNINLIKVSEIMIRCINNKLMVNILCDDDNFKEILDFDIDSLYINSKYVKGEKYLIDTFNGLKYTIYPDSFYQVNSEVMESIYTKAKECAGYGNKLLDLYCGTGTIGLYLSDKFKYVNGYEINYSSIKNANLNKEINGIKNISFIHGDCKDVKGNYDVIVVDPPRSGLSKEVVKFLNNSNSLKIIYISCNPNTLKRDVDMLNNYKIEDISFYDMFPRTKHVETICVLKKL